MASSSATDWLALAGRVNTLVTNPLISVYEPNAVFDPPHDGSYPKPFITLSDVMNEHQRLGVNSSSALHIRSGTLILSLQWPVADPIGYTKIKVVADQIASHFPADLCMNFGTSHLRVTRDADIMQTYVSGAYRITPVRVFWASM